MICSLIHTKTSDYWRPPVIDIDTQTRSTFHGSKVRYFIEFDMRAESHSMAHNDECELVWTDSNQSNTYGVTGYVSAAGPAVVVVELDYEPQGTPIGEMLMDECGWDDPDESPDDDGDLTVINENYANTTPDSPPGTPDGPNDGRLPI